MTMREPDHFAVSNPAAALLRASNVTQTACLSVSSKIVASRDDFCDITGARRLRRFNVQKLQARFPLPRLWNFERRSGVNAALLWLRLCRCAVSQIGNPRPLPTASRRNSSLPTCATRRFRGSLPNLKIAHWDHEPERGCRQRVGLLECGDFVDSVAAAQNLVAERSAHGKSVDDFVE